MARDFGSVFSLVQNGTKTGPHSPRITKNAMEKAAPVRTSLGEVKSMGVQKMTTRSERGAFGILERLSPEMARDLGGVFSLARIETKVLPKSPRERGAAARGALRFASGVAAFLLVVVVAVSLTVTAFYLVPLL